MLKYEDVISANIELHTLLSECYRETEPHYRPENIARIREVFKSIQNRVRGENLLDVGCGMGFIIDIAKDFFKRIRGIDITPAMLEKVNTTSLTCDIKVQLANSENIPFEDRSFDVCTAYAVLHHLHDLRATFKEIYRVLKPGGIFYSDLDPNYYFWKSISGLPDTSYSDIIEREINAIKYKDEELEREFNIKKETLTTAEHLKHVHGGFKEEDLLELLNDTGFSSCDVKYEWFLGEGKIIHGENTREAAHVLRNYLRDILPLSRHLFKYISIYAIK